ncbi:hypothetical protein C8R45DRAFT_1005203 [Mycena sanguinolenta]|nr:hypothetical protein C8R45DRAFT_1005203 [Mycena sanguinolenta]
MDGVRGRDAGALAQALLRTRTTRTEEGAVSSGIRIRIRRPFAPSSSLPLISLPSQRTGGAVRRSASAARASSSHCSGYRGRVGRIVCTSGRRMLMALAECRAAAGCATGRIAVGSCARESTSSMGSHSPLSIDLLHLDLVHPIPLPPSGPAYSPLQHHPPHLEWVIACHPDPSHHIGSHA